MARAGVARGVALAPGVSKNGRLYTAEHVAGAAAKLRQRLADPQARPVVMRTHHGAGDDSTRIVGRVTAVDVDAQGRLTYEADLADTTAGRDIAELARGDQPYLANVSIYGWWLGGTRRVDHDGQLVETGDDLEIDAIDFTYSPGVAAASVRVESAAPGRVVVTESAEARIMPDQPEVREGYASVSLDTGPLTINISAYGVEQPDLAAVARAAADAAAAALTRLDPDQDEDIDVPGAPAEDTDDDSMESSDRKEPAVSEATSTTAAESTTASDQLAESIRQAVSAGVQEAVAAVLAAQPQPTGTQETTSPAEATAETADPAAQAREALKAEILAELVKEGHVGTPERKGFAVAETSDANITGDELWSNRGELMAAHMFGDKINLA